jgi:hypothetical protein
MTTYSDIVRLPSGDDSIAPVTILDAEGRVLRVVSAEEFRRARPSATAESLGHQRPVISLRAKRALRRAGDSRLIPAAAQVPPSAVAS